MKNPKLAGEIIEKTVKAIKKPVTVKIRKGFDDEHVNAVEMAKIAEAAGAAAVAVQDNCELRDVDIRKVQKILLDGGTVV